MHDVEKQEILHCQSREVWELKSGEMEASKKYLIRLSELLTEKATLELCLKEDRNTALLAAVQLRRENCFLRAKGGSNSSL